VVFVGAITETDTEYLDSNGAIYPKNGMLNAFVIDAEPTISSNDGLMYMDGEFYPVSTPVPSANEQRKADEIRATRNTKLLESDWTQVADAPVDKAAWATYRQALRDITAQSGFPNKVTWPNKP
jgi:hypothetical protein